MKIRDVLLCSLLCCFALNGGMSEYFTVLEEQEVGTFVGNITRRANSKYHFSEANEYFRIDSNRATIYTKSKIDREALLKDEFHLVVLSSAPIYATEVTIKVVDINDHTPKFKSSLVNLSLSESLSVNTLIPIDSASDPDTGINTVANYSIVNNGDSNKFSLELILNLLHLKILTTLDRETKDFYTLNISALDGGNPAKFGYMMLQITVLDANDNSPLFNPSAFKSDIFENAPVGTTIHQAKATDSDIGKNGLITYSIELYNQGFAPNLFRINSTTGLITLAGELDYEKTKKYTIHVIAKDSGSPVLDGRATVTVNVKDINDNPPKIANGNSNMVNLTENKIHQYFSFFTLTDLDSSVISMTITSGNEENKFDLTKYDLPGKFYYFLSLKSKLDREDKNKYTLKFRAADNGIPPLTTNYTLIVNVMDVNDNKPVFKHNSLTANVYEGCAIGTFIGDVSADDADLGLNSKLTYSISAGNELNWFRISSHSGLITTNSANIDYDGLSKPIILLKISANDSGSPSLHSSITYNISILDVNDNAPTFNQSAYSVFVNESAAIGATILTLQATDGDSGKNGQIVYRFSYQSAKIQHYFELRKDTGELILKNKLDYNKDKFLQFYATAEDNGVPVKYSRLKVMISVLDVDNYLPVFNPTEYYFNLLAVNSQGFVGNINAVDHDSGIFGKISYSVESGDCCNGFVIDQSSGQLNSTLKIQAGVSHRLVIKGRNQQDIKAAYATVYIIALENFNLNPVFTRDSYTFNVPENAVGRFVGQVKLLPSIHSKTKVVYSITSGDDWQYFNISGDGVLVTRKSIDRERFSKFVIVISVHTNTTVPLTGRTKVTIIIDDVNDNSPEIANQMFADYSVKEDTTVGSQLLTVHATDADLGSNSVLRYSIKQHSTEKMFYIDRNSGKLFLIGSLLNKKIGIYIVDLEISDSGLPPRILNTKIAISVKDDNNNYPKFNASSYTVKVMGNLTVNTKFLQVKASDRDLNDNARVLYRIIDGNVADMFGIFPSGWLYLKQLSLDQNINYYSLWIEAYDSGTASKSTKVQVSIFVDTNKSLKLFKLSSHSINFAENLPADSIIANMTKNLADYNSLVKFSLVSSSSYVKIGADDGLLRSKAVLDREKIIQTTGSDELVFLVMAEKTTSAGVTKEMCLVLVKIADVNNYGPLFEKSNYIASVSENAASGISILKVSALDPDSTKNNAVRYELQAGSDIPFNLDATTGILSVSALSPTRFLDYESVQSYNLTALAKDVTNASLFSMCQLNVYVIDANDNKPQFTTRQTSVTIKEATNVGSTIFTFKAVDKDKGFNAFVKYSLRENSRIFGINPYSGELYLLEQLDFETKVSHSLNIVAKDLGTPSQQTNMAFTVLVSDSNDNSPVFNAAPSVIHINENVPLSSVIGKCSASDADSGRNKMIRYSVIEQQPALGTFAVDPITCSISNLVEIDRERNEVYHIILKAEDQAEVVADRLSATKNITILVADLNDNVPSFVPPLGSGFERKSTVGWQAMKVVALDPDSGVNGTVKYSILPGLDAACFVIGQYNGIISVRAPLSTTKKVFTMNVMATDEGIEKKATRALVTLFVLGSSANAPSCTSSPSVTLNEGSTIGNNVVRAQAATSESNSNMKYFIKGGNTGNSFVIDSSTGWISNRLLIDFEKGPTTYNLVVTAVELSGSLPRTVECPVNIQVSDINDNDPEFRSSSTTISVNEKSVVNTEIHKFSATDRDSGNNRLISYSIIAGNALAVFRIDADTGGLFLAKELDREKTSQYNLTIAASDKGVPQRRGTTMLIINVADFNDNKPEFNQSYYSFEIYENMPINGFIGKVHASDADSGRNGEIYYEISNGESNVFALNQMTGEIRLARNIDRETIPNYILEIRASDYGRPRLSNTIRVFVNILDINDNCPVFVQQTYTATISENDAPGKLVTTVKANDKDFGSFGTVVYSIASGDKDGRFAVSSTGHIRTTTSLDREIQAAYVLRIAAKDRRNSSEVTCFSFTTLNVTVNDINDNSPVFNLPITIKVSEDKAVESVIYALKATDKDNGPNATLVYNMIKPNDFEDVFRIDANGTIYLKSRLDYEVKNSYSFKVSVSDQGSPSRTTLTNLTVHVVDSNDNSPVINQHAPKISFLENMTIGTSVMQFTAVDKDSGENSRISFGILSGNTNLSFGIDSVAGVLFINKELDRESHSTYLLEIETKDNGVPRKRGLTTLTIVVKDVNDCTPKFNMSVYNVSVVENSVPGTLIQTTASDPDSGINGIVTYSIASSAHSTVFSIDSTSGVVSTLRQLDREAAPVIQLTIVATDGGTPALQGKTTLLVNVLDVNDNYPKISPAYSTMYIKENLPANLMVKKLSITDADYGANSSLTYEPLIGFGRFQLKQSGSSLIISTTTNLDREIAQSYNLSVTVKDGGTPRLYARAFVHVIVLDDNDFPPAFSQKTFNVKVQGGTAAQSFVTKLKVTDKDIGDNAKNQFAITSGNTSYFDIEQQTGVITTKLVLPQSAVFNIKVQVSDPIKTDFKDTATVAIATATGYPKFSHSNQYASVSESSPVDSSVLKINASSDELGPAGKIKYFVYSGNFGEVFKISKDAGWISVGRPLDYEKRTVYSLWIEAQDSSNPPLSSFLKVVISVINELDSAPRISTPTNSVSFTEQQGINALVTRVTAVDLDNPSSNVRIRYKLGNNSLHLPFHINEISGEVRSTRVLNRETKNSYNLTVIAYPYDRPWQMTSLTVNISIGDINDNPPVVHSPSSITIQEDMPLGGQVLVINATDADIGINSQISFRLISSTFNIDSKSGKITLKERLDREVKSSYLLSISVKDITFETIHELTILVSDVNDSPPYFTSRVLRINASENTSIGQTFGQVTALDKDTGLYSISFYHFEPRSGYGIFVIDPKTGSLTLKKQVKFIRPAAGNTMKENDFNFTVFARNVYPPFYQASASLVISVTDFNDHAPKFTKTVYNANVLSTASIGQSVAKLLASDTQDYGLNALVHYAILSGNGSNLFRIDGADVKVRASLASFGGKVLQLTVEARDSGTPMKSAEVKATVTVSIVEPNLYSPVFDASFYGQTIAENYELYKNVIQVKASDQDTGINGKVVYSITKGNENSQFSIGINNGSIFAVKPLDYELLQSYALSVQAKDLGAVNARFASVTVRVHLTDVNDNKPMFTATTYTASVAENQPIKTSVLKVSATDKDKVASSVIVYAIVDDASKPFFTIDGATGLIQTKTVIDYEQYSSFKIQVSATDNGSPQLSTSVFVNVKVISKNEFSPKFSNNLYNFTVTKNALIGHVIGKVKAADGDKGIDGVPMYLSRIPVSSTPFTVDSLTGEIRVSRKLSIGKFTLKLFVKNLQVAVLTPDKIDQAIVGIEVVEGNDAPWFSLSLYTSNIKEDAEIGSSVLTVVAVDPDAKPGGTVRYRLINQQPVHFSVDAASGVIAVAAKIDRETIPSYNLTIQATDNGVYPASNTTQVIIKLLDVNDMAPRVTSCSGSVYENATINTVAAKAYVQDEDLDPNKGPYSFRVDNSNEFGIISNSGDLFVKGVLDRETRAVHNVTIYVTDHGKPALTSRGFCIINLLDVSDVAPRPRFVRVIVNNLGDVSPGGLLGDVSPVDPDTSDVYTCQLNKSANLFTFQASSCKLFAASHRNNLLMHVYYSAAAATAKVPENHASIDFISLRNATADKMLSFQLNGIKMTTSQFTNNTLDSLSKFFVSVSPKDFKILIIGYNRQSGDTLNVLLVMQNKSSFVVPSISKLEQAVTANRQGIERITTATSIAVPHNACSPVNPCQNGGECTKFLKLDSSPQLQSSETIIFHSVRFNSTFSCLCKPGFHGSRCEYTVISCSPDPCLNGGVCKYINSVRTCLCSSKFTGRFCESDVNECLQLPCKNSGVCENSNGDYKCRCLASYTGKNCETLFDYCKPNPCRNGGTCSRVGDAFTCSCAFGYKGKLCEINPMTFASLSYLSVAFNQNQQLNVTFDFATYEENSLLFYGFHKTLTGVNSPFVALEIVGGFLRFSFSFGVALRRKTVGSVKASDGSWHSAKVRLSDKILTLSLDKVEDYLTINEATQSPDLGGASLFIGGIDSIKAILNRPKQVATDDFIGCMRSVYVNGRLANQSTAIKAVGVSTGCTKSKSCTGSPCKNGKCIDDWSGYQCKCDVGYSGNTCNADAKPFTFGGASYAMFKLKESYRRKLQLAQVVTSRRKRRAVVAKLPDSNSISIQLRTRTPDGILLFAKDIGGNFTALYIKDGQLHYRFDLLGKGSGSMLMEKPRITDGKWHSISLRVGQVNVSLIVDGFVSTQNSFSVSPHRFYSTYTDVLSLAGSANPLVISGVQLTAFQGCLNSTSLNGENIEQSDKFDITRVGPVTSSCSGRDVCASSPCLDPVLSYCVDNWEAHSCVHPGKCAAKPCKNNGVCVPIAQSSFNCKCRGNFTGKDCGTPLICLTLPCKSNENCVADNTLTFRCVLIAEPEKTGLSTTYIVLIVVLVVFIVAFIFLLVLLFRRRKQNKVAKTFERDFVDKGMSMELKEASKTDFENQGYESEQSFEVPSQPQQYATDESEFENEAYSRHSSKYGLDLMSKRNAEFISKSQPVFNRPLPHREAVQQKGSNRSLPLALFVKEQYGTHNDTRLNDENRLERQRNERILLGLQGFQPVRSEYDSDNESRFINERDSYGPRSNSAEALKLAAKKFPSVPKIQLGAATPPFESGFESTGSDVDSERQPASISGIGLENASSQLELYDLEVASIGFSEMSWQNDNKSLREYRRENIDRFRHFAPQLDLYDHGSTVSDRNTRSDLDRLSDVMERDSSSDSDGSFTCSEYEYGDERISSNKLKRKRLVFSTHPKHSEANDSDLDSSFRPRRNSHCSSMTSITDVGSIDRGRSAKTNLSAIPPINWDELLNWGLKYENLADVYRALASLDDPPKAAAKPVRPSHAKEAPDRGYRLQAGSERDSSAHSSQELHRKPAVVYSAKNVNEEEYV